MPRSSPLAARPLTRSPGPAARLSVDEVGELARRARSGDAAARERLILANIPLAVRLAWRWARSFPGRGDELASFAVSGLIRGVDGFDPGRGTRFSTYASFWIQQTIRRGIDDDFPVVHVPAYVAFAVRRARRGRPATNASGNPIPPEILEAATVALSWSPIGMAGRPDAEDRTHWAVAPDDDEEFAWPGGVEPAALRLAVAGLPDRHRAVIEALYLGPPASRPPTYAALGEVLGCSKAAVASLRSDALDRLRKALAPVAESEVA